MIRVSSTPIHDNLGRDRTRGDFERQGGTARAPTARWREGATLLTSSRLPSGLHLASKEP